MMMVCLIDDRKNVLETPQLQLRHQNIGYADFHPQTNLYSQRLVGVSIMPVQFFETLPQLNSVQQMSGAPTGLKIRSLA